MLHSFDAMVGIGTALIGLGLWYAFAGGATRDPHRQVVPARGGGRRSRIGARAGVGWIVTEVGRQPWIVSGYMLVEDAVTRRSGIWFIYGFTLALYIGLGVAAVAILPRL